MMLRWTASALLWAEKRFKRINGCEQLKELEKNLRSVLRKKTSILPYSCFQKASSIFFAFMRRS